jgi:outer membrane protein assembly factor BamB
VVVCACGETVNGQAGSGHVYTFNANTGALMSTLTSPNAQARGSFGSSLAVSGNIVVVGALGEGETTGHAYTFNAQTGDLISSLTSPNAQAQGLFGSSVAAVGNIVVVGAPFETANGLFEAGHVYTFNANTGDLIGTLTSPNAQPGEAFGSSVAARGNILVVGAPGVLSSRQTLIGSAYAFNAETGALIGTLTSPNAQSGGGFGWSAAARGSDVVVGAPFETASGHMNAGHAYTFNAKTGALISTFTSPNAKLVGVFGSSVAASGNVVVVGAAEETANGQFGAGRAYIF